jgi:plasmid stabilization system protein ParE
MNLVLLPQASAELADAAGYYEGEQTGLGERLWLEVDDNLRWIAANATLPRLRHGDYRRVNLKVFPYYIAYALRHETVVVLAIAHSHRQPEYWIGRHSGGAA